MKGLIEEIDIDNLPDSIAHEIEKCERGVIKLFMGLSDRRLEIAVIQILFGKFMMDIKGSTQFKKDLIDSICAIIKKNV